jgi:phospholipase/carboxylesterase
MESTFMSTTEDQYWATVRSAEDKLLRFLRTVEAMQEDILIGREKEAQERVRVVADEVLPALTAELAKAAPSDSQQGFHTKLAEAVACCVNTQTALTRAAGRNFGEWFLRSRQSFCQGLYLLYEIRAQLSTFQPYWLTADTVSPLSALEASTPGLTTPVGFVHKPRTNTHAEYSLYVPENYTLDRRWPLIVCLHGGYGQGNEYIWTWLRPAKSHGYLLLSPKSLGPTWSVLNPPLDIGSIRAMLTEVFDTYMVDTQRVYLSGLSDGGTFSYLLGLSTSDVFAGIAPIAGDFHPMLDPILRQKRGIEVPLLIVHGVLDAIFPVASIRQARTLMEKIGYSITYRELPDWGHAYPYRINEQIVLPWFASL